MNYDLQQLKKTQKTQNKKPPLDNRSSRNIAEQFTDKQTLNVSFNEKKNSTPKINALLQELQKRTNQKDQYFNRTSTPNSQHEKSSTNKTQRSISPQLLYQIPQQLKKIYQHINSKVEQDKMLNKNQKPDSSKCKTEESKSHKNESTSSTINDSEEYVQQFINLEEIVFTILAVISKKQKVIKQCQNYLNQITNFIVEEKDQIRQQILCKSMILERIGILVVLYKAISEAFDEDQQNLKNLVFYIHSSMVLHLELMQQSNALSQSQKALIQARLNKLRARKTLQLIDINLIRKNSNVVYSLLILLQDYLSINFSVENATDNNLVQLEKVLTIIDKINLQQGTKFVKYQFDKILVHIQQLRLTRDSSDFQFDYEEVIDCQQIPYLSKTNKYTLVIDLDETLVHYQELVDDGQFLVRPYAQQFLKEMSKYYEIVIFTAAQQDYADFILDLIDEDKVIGYRLYRQHTTLVNNTYVKDIQKIGRDVKRTIIIDNLAENFKFQPDNGIQIHSWYGDQDDQALLFLSPLLIQIVQKKIPDVRDALRKFRDQMQKNIENGIQDPHLHLSLD
ncbi:unnamed protein product (macronuclear) [Paramecium tetraurelia]|uniref:Mitochondrial import inner membrane translocase subunit TIM50 n=1 Tax=Paramecium tetraurelia TaxID=5888 RepID=A0EHC1_PARTE|nr:uncharacterized protein GSPATT00027036001 [Paramecium tetraurelia]CAK94712.1 unnamed protein product [Paramecium tetraurelia]|eukprot:XP_001462085.1 hypothetical protein (macronuclear) [Paramecium tetraurelia strain d4-2]